jgi:hypothetical protein
MAMEKIVPIDIDESCVELVKRFHTLDRQVQDMIFGAPGYDHSVLEALEVERANVSNLAMFHLGAAFRQCGYFDEPHEEG